MSIKKQFLKLKPVCKVSFKISTEDANGASKIQVLGDFNNWDKTTAPMKGLKAGGFSQTVELEVGKEFQFRYLLDGEIWTNEADADATVSNAFNELNDVISTVR